MPIIKGIEHVINFTKHLEKNQATLNKKCWALQRKLDRAGIDIKSQIMAEVDGVKVQMTKNVNNLGERTKGQFLEIKEEKEMQDAQINGM